MKAVHSESALITRLFRIKIKVTTAIIVAFVPFSANSLTFEYPIDELLNHASDVAVVDIMEGRVTELNGRICGTVYQARVIDSLKGATTKTIEFGNEPGLEIGKRYLVILSNKKDYLGYREWLFRVTRRNFENEDKADKAVREWRGCRAVIPSRMVAAYGLAAMPIENPSELGYQTPAIKVSLTIWLPPQTKCTKATSVSLDEKSIDTVWIKQDEMRRVIKQILDRPEGAKIVGGPGKYPITPRDCDEPINQY